MYVDDGVCDYDLCCDGSDELGHVGGIQCENRCEPIGKEYRRLQEERRQSRERAVRQRQVMVKEARELRRRMEAKVAALKDELKGLEVKKEELQKKFEEVERSERNKIVKAEAQGGKLGVLVGLAKARVSELRGALDKLLDQRDDLQDRLEQLEDILAKLKAEYNPNFNDEGVKAAVKSWEDYAASLGQEKDSDLSDTEIMDILKEDGETSGINWAEFENSESGEADIGECISRPPSHPSIQLTASFKPTIGRHSCRAPSAASSATRSTSCAFGPSRTASWLTLAAAAASLAWSLLPGKRWMLPGATFHPRLRRWKSSGATWRRITVRTTCSAP